MPLGRPVINDEVLPFDPAMIAHAVLPYLVVWQVQGRGIKIADPARRPLCPRTLWRNEQCRSTRYEIPPLHSILIRLEDDWRKVTRLNDSRIRGANAATRVRCEVQDR